MSSQPASSHEQRPRSTIIRWAFAVEAVFNIFGAIPMLLYPSAILSLAAPSSSSLLTDSAIQHPASILAATPSNQSISLLRWLGALTLGLTPQLLLGITEAPWAVASRRMVYITLGAGEVALIVTMLAQAALGDEAAVGLSNKWLIGSAANLAVICMWRAYVLVLRPELFGAENVKVDSSGALEQDIKKSE